MGGKMLEEFRKERDTAMASKDKEKILAFCEKYNIPAPKDEDLFWAGVHKAVCHLFLASDSSVSIESYTESYDWLKDHGYDPTMLHG